jgi:probable HAF family extracellular repeat protein
MNPSNRSSLARVTSAVTLALGAVALLTAEPANVNAAEGQAPPHYRLKSLPNEGGLYNAVSINNEGWVAGVVEPAGDALEHAALWRRGALADLGTLGGPNSSVPFPMKSDIGRVVGSSDTGQLDPYAENYCAFTCNGSACLPVNYLCRGFLWQDKTTNMIPLPPLPAGLNSIAYGTNNQEIVGASENGVVDAGCQAPQVFDFEGVVWRISSSGRPFIARQLPPLAGDAISAAVQVNQTGIAVGGSGRCGPLGPGISVHAVAWAPGGEPMDLGSLGGAANNLALAINDLSEIVGISNIAGDQATHCFLWEHGRMHDLDVLRPGDTFCLPGGINNLGEIVGFSCGAADCRAWHWQTGVTTDLNAALVGAPPGLVLQSPNDINDRGEIAAAAFDQTFGDQVGVLLEPIEDARP